MTVHIISLGDLQPFLFLHSTHGNGNSTHGRRLLREVDIQSKLETLQSHMEIAIKLSFQKAIRNNEPNNCVRIFILCLAFIFVSHYLIKQVIVKAVFVVS